jgi:hypothetical protein
VKAVVKRIGPRTAAPLFALFVGTLALCSIVPLNAKAIVSGTIGLSFLFVQVVFVLGATILGGLAGYLFAWSYNKLVPYWGGIEVEIEQP